MGIYREENIFYNLIKNETSLTEVFCNFMKYENFRNLFIDMINEKIKNKENVIDKSILKFQDFDTEVALNNQKHGRIDLQLKINAHKIYLFEIKIETYTNLTDNQPKGYLDYLEELELEIENLFFILPKRYFYLNKIKNHNIIYWEDILKQIRKLELHKENIFINEFCNILDYKWFYFEKIEFTENELGLIFKYKVGEDSEMFENSSVPSLINKLCQIIVDTKVEHVKKDKDSIWQRCDYFGYFLENSKYEISDKLTIWFGIDYNIWEVENHPIIIQIEKKKQAEKENIKLENFLKDKINYNKFIYENGDIIFYIPLEKEIFEKEDKNITEELTDKIHQVINLLQYYK